MKKTIQSSRETEMNACTKGLTRRALLAGTAGLLATRAVFPGLTQAGRARIEIMPGELGNVILPDNFGYLLEVIGTSIYDGIWVGEKSKIANVNGIRKDVIEHLKQIGASVI